MKRLITFIILLAFSTSSVLAQQAMTLSTASAAYCPYTFTRDLKVGSSGADVKVLQQILNSDRRTLVSVSGTGAPGLEGSLYGAATRDAVKRFQALFIEYIGVANGVFGPKTRTVMNAVCNGAYYTKGTGQSYSEVTTQNTINNNITTNTTPNTTTVTTSTTTTISTTTSVSTTTTVNTENPNTSTTSSTTTNTATTSPSTDPIATSTASTTASTTATSTAIIDTLAPSVFLRSNSTAISAGVSFRMILTASEPIQAFTPDSVIIEGGTVSDLRKLAPNSFSILVTPSEGSKSVLAQIEADRILDLAGNKNDNASNEIRIAVIQRSVTATTTATNTTITLATPTTGVSASDLDSIFNKLIAQVTPATTPTPAQTQTEQPTTCTNGATNYPYCNNQYSSQPPNYNSGSSNGQNQQNSLMNMLLLSSLLGGKSNSGGGLFGNLFGDNKQPQNSGSGGQNGGSGGSTGNIGTGSNTGNSGNNNGNNPAADVQACATDKTKCSSNNTGNNSNNTGGDNDFKGAKVEKIYRCQALAPSVTGPISQLKNESGDKQMFLQLLSTSNNKTVAQYAAKLDDQQDAAKRVTENACYMDNNIVKKPGNLICCKEVRYSNGTYFCTSFPELNQTKPTYTFTQKVDFSNKNCSVGSQGSNNQTSPTNNTRQADEQKAAQQQANNSDPYQNSPANKDASNCSVSGYQWNPQTQKCEMVNYNQKDSCGLGYFFGRDPAGCTDSQITNWCNSFPTSDRQVLKYGSSAGKTNLDINYPFCVGKYTLVQ